MNIRHRTLTLLISGLIFSQITGCAVEPLRTPRASATNSAKLANLNLSPVSLGIFQLDPKLDKKLDQSVTIRTNFVTPPSGVLFSQYLADTLRVELNAAGIYDPTAATQISADLTRNYIDITSPFSPGHAELEARFMVTRAGTVRFDRVVKTASEWSNAFAAVEAVPVARGQYEVIYRKLVGALFDDPEFRTAISKE